MSDNTGYAISRRLGGARLHAPDLGREPREWLLGALCAQVTVEESVWYPGKGGSANHAKRVCQRCAVRAECLAFAMDCEGGLDSHRFGIFGGLTPNERRDLAKTGWRAGDSAPDMRIGLRKRAVA